MPTVKLSKSFKTYSKIRLVVLVEEHRIELELGRIVVEEQLERIVHRRRHLQSFVEELERIRRRLVVVVGIHQSFVEELERIRHRRHRLVVVLRRRIHRR